MAAVTNGRELAKNKKNVFITYYALINYYSD